MGLELEELQLGIIGFGASGIELARRAMPFGMKIAASTYGRSSKRSGKRSALSFVGTPDDLEKVVAESDVLSLHLHLNSETHHIIDARMLDLMKPTAYIINVARGALIDEEGADAGLARRKTGRRRHRCLQPGASGHQFAFLQAAKCHCDAAYGRSDRRHFSKTCPVRRRQRGPNCPPDSSRSTASISSNWATAPT